MTYRFTKGLAHRIQVYKGPGIWKQRNHADAVLDLHFERRSGVSHLQAGVKCGAMWCMQVLRYKEVCGTHMGGPEGIFFMAWDMHKCSLLLLDSGSYRLGLNGER